MKTTEFTLDYFALINEVNKTKTLLEILNILNNDYKKKRISLSRYEMFISHLDIAIRFNELMRQKNN